MAKSINEIQDEIIEEFGMLDDWMDRYELIIDAAKGMKKQLPETDKTDQNLIDGCQSKVWITATMEEGRMQLCGDSDALLVKGIVALLLSVLDDHTPEEIARADLYFIDRIGLREHLSPTRSNGVTAMLKQIHLFALAYQAK